MYWCLPSKSGRGFRFDTTGTLSSEFGDGLRLIGYNPSYQSVMAICPHYVGTTVNFLAPALTAQALAIEPQTTTVTDSARTITLKPVYLPPYSPDFNPIERLWQHLKGQYLAGFITAKGEELEGKILASLLTLLNQSETIRSVCSVPRLSRQ